MKGNPSSAVVKNPPMVAMLGTARKYRSSERRVFCIICAMKRWRLSNLAFQEHQLVHSDSIHRLWFSRNGLTEPDRILEPALESVSLSYTVDPVLPKTQIVYLEAPVP